MLPNHQTKEYSYGRALECAHRMAIVLIQCKVYKIVQKILYSTNHGRTLHRRLNITIIDFDVVKFSVTVLLSFRYRSPETSQHQKKINELKL